MTTQQQAKQILLAYRPWATTAQDPEMVEALALCRGDAELANWFEAHCAAQLAIRSSLKKIKPPEAFREQIISEVGAQLRPAWYRRPAFVAVAALIVTVIAITSIITSVLPGKVSREEINFATYRTRMIRSAVKSYGMDVETNDVTQIRNYLAQNKSHADYAVPAKLDEKSTVGCALLNWQGKPVAMICYRTGRPLAAGSKSDMFLFVADSKDVPDSPQESAPQFSQVGSLATASWSQNGKVYVLAALDEAELKARL